MGARLEGHDERRSGGAVPGFIQGARFRVRVPGSGVVAASDDRVAPEHDGADAGIGVCRPDAPPRQADGRLHRSVLRLSDRAGRFTARS
jgi:hypothetical protein